MDNKNDEQTYKKDNNHEQPLPPDKKEKRKTGFNKAEFFLAIMFLIGMILAVLYFLYEPF